MGVLIPGHLILTAAHCVKWRGNGDITTDSDGGDYAQRVQTERGLLRLCPYAVEPVADVAILGALDSQTFASDSDRFESFCDRTEPLELFIGELVPSVPTLMRVCLTLGCGPDELMGFSQMEPPQNSPGASMLPPGVNDTPEKRRLLRRLARLESPQVKALSRLVAFLLPGRGSRK